MDVNVNELRARHATLKNAAAQAQGRLDALDERLKTEYDLDSWEAADKTLADMKVNVADLQAKLDAEIQTFKQKYGHIISI